MIQMRPRLPIDDAANGVARDAILPSQYVMQRSCCGSLADVTHLFCIQFLPTEASLPAFANRIQHVVVMRTEEHVGRVDAPLLVAVMAQLQTIRNVAAGRQPREPMRADALLTNAEHAIATVANVAAPE